MTAELWIPPSATRKDHRKAPPPKLGEKFGNWAGRGDVHYLTLPGGGVLQFDLSKLTLADYRQMRDHYQINASLSVLTFMMHQLDWHVECEDQKIADEVERQLTDNWTRLIRSMAQAYWAGYSPIVTQWENNLELGKVEVDKFKDLRPEECRVHWREVDGYAPPGRVKPKLKVFDGIVQGGMAPTEGMGMSDPIPVNNSLWYPLLMENGDYYGKKLLRPAFPPWFFSLLIHLFANRYFERFGEPLPIGRADFEAEVEMNGTVMNGREAMEEVLLNLRNRSVVTLPSERDSNTREYTFDLEYLESQMRGADWERYLSRLDEEMSLGLFTPILLFRTGDVGSYNLGVSHQQMFMWMLNALAGDIKEYVDKYVCERIKAFNFSPKAPAVKWVPRKMGKENVELFRGIVVELMRRNKAKPDLDELGQAVGLSLTEVRQVTSDGDPEQDPRIGRADDRPSPGGPRPPGEPRDTEREISARVSQQVTNAFKMGSFGNGYRPHIEPGEARWADSVNRWLEDAVALGPEAFSGPEEFIAMFNRVVDEYASSQ